MNAPDLHMEDQRIDDLYHVPAVLTVPSLVDEDTLNDDNRKLQLLSFNKRRIIQTRSTSKRKPSRYQISPYIAGPVNVSTKYRYGPFRIGIQLNIYDEQLITYIFDKKLPSSEVIIDVGNLRVTRKSFRTLELTKYLDSESLDIVLAFEIVVAFSTSFSFMTFSISYAEAPNQPNDYDCGLFLCMFMDENYRTPLQMKSFQSECQRLFWARILALFPGNTNLLTLKKNSQEHYNKLVSNNEVMPIVKMRPPPMKKLKGKVAALME
ncbi:hypothetical protein Q3G72_004398 [Acer saccharum]|nr:hypothetical protein Q3G72_004398 [Acer saccharum]